MPHHTTPDRFVPKFRVHVVCWPSRHFNHAVRALRLHVDVADDGEVITVEQRIVSPSTFVKHDA